MKRPLPLALVGAVAILSIVETASSLTAPGRVAGDDDWRAAADEVRAGFKPGDLIVFAPEWEDQVGRRWLGDLTPVEMLGRSDDARYARVWEVSIRGARYAATRALSATATHDHGHVRVALYQRPTPPVEVTYDFTAQLGDALVTEVPPGGRGDERPCYNDPGDPRNDEIGFKCPGARITRRTMEVEYRPRRGVLVPVDGGWTTRLDYAQAKLGGRLRVWTGLHDYYARKSSDEPVHFEVFVDGKLVFATDQGNAGWNGQIIDVPDGTHDVRFDIRAARAAWRNLGFHAESVRK